MTKKEQLLEQKELVQTAINNIMAAGQEFQTRTSRVKMPELAQLRQELAQIDTQLAELEGDGYTLTVLQKFGGW